MDEIYNAFRINKDMTMSFDIEVVGTGLIFIALICYALFRCVKGDSDD